MNAEIASLILQLASYLKQITRELGENKKDIQEWQSDFLRLLAQYLMLAMMRGAQTQTLTTDQDALVADALRAQARYLNGFAEDITASGWQENYVDRAALYADSLRNAFWQGETGCLNLPILPGSPKLDCGQFCKCYLEIKWLDKAKCDADVYWHTTHAEVSPDCARLEQEWSPLRVRNGVPET